MKDECRDTRSLFDRFLDGELLPEELDRLRAHVESCEGCRNELQEEHEIAAELGSLPELECPDNVLQGVRETVGNREEKIVRIDGAKSRFRINRRQWVAAGLAAAVAAYLLIGSPLMDRGGPIQATYSPGTIRQARNTAKWSLAYAAVMVKETEVDAIEAVLHERFPSTLKKGVRRVTEPTSGGRS